MKLLSSAPERTIVHLDLDAFFVAVEVLRNPALQGLPLAIGGGGERGVVASCSYEARRFGVRSAMPGRLAKQLCPDLIFLRGDMEAYSRHSQLITEVIADQAPLFEKASIDEFFLDISGMDRFFGCWKWAQELRQKLIKESGLSLSLGMAINKMVSKVAAGEVKPAGEGQVLMGQEESFLAPLPIRKLPGVGAKTGRLLLDMGIQRVQTLADMPPDLLQASFGRFGLELWRRAHGQDDSPVLGYSERKSVSAEETFAQDTIDMAFLRGELVRLVEKVAFRLRKQQKLTACITVKIRYADFETVSKQRQIAYTASDHVLLKHAHELFSQLYQRRLRIRLLGVRVSHLVHGQYQISLFEDTEEQVRLYQAIDRMKNKYGEHSLGRAIGVKGEELWRG